jgi:glyoxylase-like metal-dependent hydrolase (beta-lactamase superfamily II)
VGELSWWLSPHPDWEDGEDWPREVPVVRYETDEDVVLIDPFPPPGDSFDSGGKPVRVLLTQGAHYRGTADFVNRYGASVWAPPRAVWRKRPNPATTTELPRDVEALELDGEPQQVLFLIREHATLVSGDVLTGRDGMMHVFVDEADREPLLASLEQVAGLPIERVIVPHCETPEFLDGAAHIRAAVAEARASSSKTSGRFARRGRRHRS